MSTSNAHPRPRTSPQRWARAPPRADQRGRQEDKEPLFETVDVLRPTLEVMAGMLLRLSLNAERAASAAAGGYLLATDVADYLVGKGVPFRDAHQAVAELVRYAVDQDKPLAELTLDEYRRFSPQFQEDVLSIDARSSIDARDVPGGTASGRVAEALAEAKKRLDGAA